VDRLKSGPQPSDIEGMSTTGLGHACDEGGIVLSWLVKIVAIFAVVGVIVFDGLSIGTAKLSIEDQGAQAARDASDQWQLSHDVKLALAAAGKSAQESNPANEIDPATFRIDSDGTVHLTITREASTLVAHRISPLRGLCDVQAAAQGRTSS
jgi:hypothetical protein